MSKERQIKRLAEQLDVMTARATKAEEDYERTLDEKDALRIRTDLEIKVLKETLAWERNARVSAQRGLVVYMKEMGLGERIGYNPDQDPSVQREIAEGKVAPKTDLKWIAEAVIAARISESGQIQAGGLPDPTAPLTSDSTLGQTVG